MHGGEVRPVDGQLDVLVPPSVTRPRPSFRVAASTALPAIGLAVVVAVLLLADPIRSLTGAVPAESLAVERTVLEPGTIELHVRNDAATAVVLAQVQVNDAYWRHRVDDRHLGRLDGATVRIDYPWEPGVPLQIALLTSTGVVIEHDVDNPTETPGLDGDNLRTLGLVGLLIAPIPIALGVAWLPALRRMRAVWFEAAMAFTVGLLAFLVVDSAAEGVAAAGDAPGRLDGVGLFAVGALVALALVAVISAGASRGVAPQRRMSSLRLALLVALGIGLHNLGEGLAVGVAVTTGEVALGTALVVGFAVHNLTEGVAIAGPLSGSTVPNAGTAATKAPERWGIGVVTGLVAVAGLPVLVGLWLGGFVLPEGWAALAFGLAAGALAEVVWAVLRWLRDRGATLTPLVAGAFAAAVALMYATGVAAG
jgi:zinc transporter, ZIP family